MATTYRRGVRISEREGVTYLSFRRIVPRADVASRILAPFANETSAERGHGLLVLGSIVTTTIVGLMALPQLGMISDALLFLTR